MRWLKGMFRVSDFSRLLAVLFVLLVPALASYPELPSAMQERLDTAQTTEAEAHAQRMQNNIEEARRLDFEARGIRLEVIELLHAAVNHRELDVVFDSLLAQYIHLGYHDLAAELLEKALAYHPEDAGLWLRLGQNRMDLGPAGKEAAMDALMRAQALASPEEADYAEVAYALARLYYGHGLYSYAREHVETAVEMDAGLLEAQVMLAALDARDGDILAASERLEDLGRDIQPLDAVTRIWLRECLAHFDKTRGSFPDTAAQHFAYSRLLYRAARIHEAVLALQRCTTLQPENIEAWNFLAAIHLQIGNYPAGRQAYERSLDINPEQPQIQASYDQLVAFMEEMEAQRQQQLQQQPTPTPEPAPDLDLAPIPLR